MKICARAIVPWILSSLVAAGCGDLRALRALAQSQGARADAGGAVATPVDAAGADSSGPADSGGADVRAELDIGAPDLPTFDEPPLVADLYPARVSVAGGTLVTVEGARLTLDTQVLIGGVPVAALDLIDQHELLFVAPPKPAGAYSVKLVNAAGTGVFDGVLTYAAALRIDALEPADGPSTGGTPIVVHGAALDPTLRLVFGERVATPLRALSAERLEVALPPAAGRGLVDVIALGAEVVVLEDAFAYFDPPVLTQLHPSVGRSSGGQTVTVLGAGIDEDCTLAFGTIPAAVFRAADGRLGAMTPGGQPGAVDLTVDCGPRGAALLPAGFSYRAGADAAIWSLDPAVGLSRGGAVVTLGGPGVEGATSVEFGVSTARIVGRGDGWIEVIAPPGRRGAVAVVARTAGGALPAPEHFSYRDAPIVTSVTPSSGPAGGGWNLLVAGTRLGDVEHVVLDGRALSVSTQTDTAVVAQVPSAPVGMIDVLVDVAGLRIDTGFDVALTGPRRFDDLTPRAGPAAGGTRLFVTGEGFSHTCRIRVGDAELETEVIAGVLLAAVTRAAVPGPAPVAVVGCGATWDAPRDFVFFDPTALPGGASGGTLAGALHVSVIEASTDAPIEGATVYVGTREGSPYVGLTDTRGQISFTGDDLAGPVTVSAYADERSAETYVDVDASRVTLVLNPLPSPPCDPADPSCQPPPAPPTGTVIGFLTGLEKLDDPPPGARVGALIETTRYVQGYPNPDPGPGSVLYENGPFEIVTRLGEQAVFAQCGWFLADGSFVARRLGVTRGGHIRDPATPWRTTIDCGLRLDEELTFKLPAAPALREPDPAGASVFPVSYALDVSYDLGAEGHIDTMPRIVSMSDWFSVAAFPPLSGPLEFATLSCTASAMASVSNLPIAQAFVRSVASYERMITFPPMLPLPELTAPSAADPRLTEGYIAWDHDTSLARADFYHVTVSSGGVSFPRWTVIAPGDARSITLPDFPDSAPDIGWVPRPGAPEAYLTVVIRAVDVSVFDYDSITRLALRSSNWEAASAAYWTVTLAP